MRPALRLAGLTSLGFALYLYGASSEVAWLFLIAFWVWGLALAALAYALWNRRGVRARITLHVSHRSPTGPLHLLSDQLLRTGPLPEPVFEGDVLAARLEFRSDSGSRGPARLQGRVGERELGGGLGLVPPRWTAAEEQAWPQRRGVVALGGWRLETSDPLGLFRHGTRLEETAEVVVLPTFAELGQAPQQREIEASLAARRAGAGTELFGVREYRPGDPLRRIHWRSSARHGELIVREFEPPGLRTLELLLDPDPPSPEAADQAARIAASEVWETLRAGGQAYLRAPGLRGTGPRESRSLWALLEWLGRYPGESEEHSAAPPAGEAVVIATRPDGAALEEAAAALARGSMVRGWLLGFQAPQPFPVREAGLRWPL